MRDEEWACGKGGRVRARGEEWSLGTGESREMEMEMEVAVVVGGYSILGLRTVWSV